MAKWSSRGPNCLTDEMDEQVKSRLWHYYTHYLMLTYFANKWLRQRTVNIYAQLVRGGGMTENSGTKLQDMKMQDMTM